MKRKLKKETEVDIVGGVKLKRVKRFKYLGHGSGGLGGWKTAENIRLSM